MVIFLNMTLHREINLKLLGYKKLESFRIKVKKIELRALINPNVRQ
jgi:hypothetical protein